MLANLERKIGFLSALAAMILTGCGPDMPDNVSRVSGTVTLEGQPLPGALVTFVPQKQGGSTSLGKTDDVGKYTLSYGGDIQGAEIGSHKVTITTYSSGSPDSDPPLPKVPEKVPLKYNEQTELTADVKAGDNTIDFPLKNDGPIRPEPVESSCDCGGE
jgi:hypothetical protein